MYSHWSLLLALLPIIASPAAALVYPGPRATDTSSDVPDATGWTPKPTPAPFHQGSVPDLRPKHLRRQEQSPDTCGYAEGDPDLPFTCDTGSACAYDPDVSYFGCCQTDFNGDFVSSDCAYIATPYTGCYDYTSADQCLGACYTENRVCDSSAPYCASVLLFTTNYEVLTHFGCVTGTDIRVIDLEPTTTGGGASPTSQSLDSNQDNSITTTVVSGTSPAAVTSSAAFPSQFASRQSHAGAIAGGVIGGLAILGIAAGAAIWFLRKRKKSQRKSIMPEVSQM